MKHIAIIGAGTIGLSIGWKLAEAGHPVQIFERDQAGRGTSWAAAGMLMPIAEIGFEEVALFRFNSESLRRWPAFTQSLESASGLTIDYRNEGALLVADDPDSAKILRRKYEFQRAHNLPVTWLSGAEALDLEPFLAPRLAAAIHMPTDHQVDNRRLLRALQVAFEKAGGTLHEQTPIKAVVPDEVKPRLVTEAGDVIETDHIIVAAGAWSRQLEGLQPHVPEIRPVKGQMLELHMTQPAEVPSAFGLHHVIRSPNAYLAPKSDGRLLVGATSEEMGFDTTVTAGGLYHILEHAWRVVPGIYDLQVTDTWAGLRPASRDHAPLLGASGLAGIFYATGHYRHGILLTPITAEEMAYSITTDQPSAWLKPFAPARFH